ncbi:MAG: calcium/sodium antiporter [Fidelibacterota bacterium]|nr:MAG: calcium/sodium antiporter [Candidatus Neomarinimicrobiota bacterium]
MILASLFLMCGIGLLYLGAEGLVWGGSRLAKRLRVATMVIGLSVVAFGTSLPEFTVSLYAVITNAQDIAIGNVVGSNIANVALILASSAVIFPVVCRYMTVRDDLLIVIGITMAFLGFSFDGELSRIDGALMTAGILLYILRLARSPTIAPDVPILDPGGSVVQFLAAILVGLIALAVGTHLFITSAVTIADYLGIPELVIGATIVAVGTSLPELATSIVAAVRKQSEIVLGNILGSNVFNLIAVLGIIPLIRPIHVPVQSRLIQMPIMLGLTLALLPMLKFHQGVKRGMGYLLLAIYAGFTAYMYLSGGS